MKRHHLLVPALLPALVTAQAVQFGPDQNRLPPAILPADSGQSYERLLVGDLDGDGRRDLVSSGAFASRVHLQAPDGSFVTSASTLSGVAARPPIDLDGDGDLDLITTGGSAFHVHGNNGAGAFPTFATFGFLTGSVARAVVPGDFDGDGDLDLVIGTDAVGASGSASPYLRYFRNLGGGSFVPSTSALPVIGTRDCRPVAGDFDGDGDLDLVVGVAASPTLLLRNTGGLFTIVAGAMPAAAANHAQGTAGDFDGDGDLDVVTRTHAGRIDLLQNLGSSTFALVEGIVPATALDFGFGDSDGDGDLDLLLQQSGVVLEFAGDGAGGWSPRATLNPGGTVSAIAVADFDGNALADVLVAWQGTVLGSQIAHGSQAGPQFDALYVHRLFPPVADDGFAASADLDGNGLADLVVGPGLTSPTPLTILQNRGLQGWRAHPIGSAPFPVRSLQFVDLDRDTDLDLVVVGPALQGGMNTGYMKWFVNTGSFGFVDLGIALTVYPHLVRFGDLDGDGDADMVSVSAGDVRLHRHGDFGVGSGVLLPVTSPAGYPNDLLLVDIDGDVDLDIVTGKVANGCMDLLVNDGTGTFTLRPGCGLPRTAIPTGMAAGDVDGDGDVDLLTFDVQGVRLHLNDGSGTFTEATGTRLPPTLAASTTELLLFDADADGDLDIVANQVFAENTGGGVFVDRSAARWTPGLTEFRHLVDLDADGDAEVWSRGTVSWNHLRQLSTTAVVRTGGALTLQLAQSPGFAAGGFALCAIGFAPRAVPLVVPGIAGAWQISSAGTLPLVFAPVPIGVQTVTMPIPAIGALAGLDLFGQALCVDGAGRAGFTGPIVERVR